jgi:tetratricopeptide repeat protein 21B
MSEAMSEYAGTPEEIRVTVAHADLALARGEVEAALRILEAIKPEQARFLFIFLCLPQYFLRRSIVYQI